MQHVASWLVILNKVTAVISRIAGRYAAGWRPTCVFGKKSGRSGKGRIHRNWREFPKMPRPTAHTRMSQNP